MHAPVASAELDKSQLRSLTQRFWRTAHGFWTGDQRRVARIMTVSLIALIVLQTFIAYQLNVWNRNLFDGMEKKDGAVVLRQAIIFAPLAVAGIVVAVAIVYARMRLQRRWRAWLTEALGDRWLNKGRYYQLNFIGGDHANPEYRLAEDMRVATEAPVDLATGILTAFLTAATFIGVLWVVGGGITIDRGGSEIAIPGYLVIAVVIYCAIISTSMMFIARSFIPVAEAKNQAEAEFRYALTRLRENGESIAILGGEQEERAGLAKLLAAVINAWARMAGQYMRTMAVSHGNFVIASVIPVILCAPKYLAGTMSLGEVMQAAAAFVQVQYAFNWIVDNYPKIAEWTASARRVSGLMVSLDHLDRLENDGTVSAIKRLEADGAAISLRDLSVALSTGKVVVDDVDVNVDLGEKVLLAGESGSGKSTLVRAIAGLWPWGEGEIITRPGTRLFLMPQKPYLPLGTLRRAATYPKPADEVDDDELRQALADVGLEHLADRLDEEEVKWSDVLSGGEQQRVGLVRLLLHKPDIAIMDESTSALDPEGQAKVFERLGERLPKTAVISVGHRLELEAFHDRKLKLVRQEGGATLVPGDVLGPPVSLMTLMMKRWRGPRDRKVASAPA
jgi:vitamin B12/bleomycin/antimicrobial peptide transport system ATP-binding/permease protein